MKKKSKRRQRVHLLEDNYIDCFELLIGNQYITVNT